MREITRLTSTAIAALVLLGVPAVSMGQGGARVGVAAPTPSMPGVIDGMVTDEKGAPLPRAIVSVTGTVAAFAVTDSSGRFELRQLPAGTYSLSTKLAGFTSQPVQITLLANGRMSSKVSVRRIEPPILAAGLGISGIAAEQPAQEQSTASTEAPASSESGDGELAWRLGHGRRSVLKDADFASDLFPADERSSGGNPLGVASHAADTTLRFAADFITETQFTGEVNLLTTGTFESPRDLLTTNGLSRGITFLSLSAPAGSQGDWTVRGAFTQADISAWILSGAYRTRETADRIRDFGVSYSTQRYDGGNPLALSEVTDGSRNVGEIYGFETYSPVSGLALNYGARYARYDYLDGRNLVSPRLEITLIPDAETRLFGSVSSRALAPGAEEFLPPSENGIWLPPQRTFSSIEPGRPLTAEHTLTAQVGVKRDIGQVTIGARAFHQRVDDQLITLFGAEMRGQPDVKVGHYFVGSAGDAKATGGAVSVETEIGGRFSGSVEYSLANARLRLLDDLRYVVFMGPTTGRPYAEHIHDVSAMVRATVPETSTNLLVVYRVGNSFAQATQGIDGTSAKRAFDSRFDVQVRQSLPFLDFRTARWEMLVAVRNFFRETAMDQSIYDELLVVRPPKRVVGGLTMLF